MKARVKATGEIVEINESSTIYDARMCHVYNASELESALDNPDYWTRLEHQYAGMAMQGILANKDVDVLILSNKEISFIANRTIELATALVEKMKEERK